MSPKKKIADPCDTKGSCVTRTKIVNTARSLFSRFGFRGTSVRDIAHEAGANLAAVNYHFKNKENLFWEVIANSYSETEKLCERLSKNAQSIEDLALKVFDHFRTEEETIRNTMKLILSEELEPPEDSAFKQYMVNMMGPPGARYFGEFLKKEVPYELSAEGLFWGVKGTFGTVMHWSTLCTATHIKSLRKTNPLLKEEQIRKDVQQMVRAIVNHLKGHPELFGVK